MIRKVIMKVNNKGQALIEYVLIITLITTVTTVAILYLGNTVRDQITKIVCEVSGTTYVAGDKPGNAKCEG